MGRFVSGALQLRLELQVKLGRPIAQREIASAVTERLEKRIPYFNRRVDRRVISRIENNESKEYDVETMNELGSYYSDYGLDVSKLLRFEPNNKAVLISAAA